MLHVIVTGTDPVSKKGGIGFALPAYLSALSSANISHESIPTYSPNNNIGKYLLFLLALPQICCAIRKSRKARQIPIIYSHAGANISLLREGIISLISQMMGAKTVMQIHSPETIDYLSSPLKKLLFKFSLIGVDKLFLLSPWWMKIYMDMGIKKPMSVVPNPMPMEWELTARKNINHKNKSDKINILVMSRIVQGKGADLVIEASSYLSGNFIIDIAGDGSLLKKLKDRVKQLRKQNHIFFYGWVADEKKQNLINSADIFCHPTQLDAMPMNILESMANGLPIVALDWGPIPDLVPNQKAGILVKGNSPKNISKAIKQLENSNLREKMGYEAKKWVLENFTIKIIGKTLQENFSIYTTYD